MAPRSALIVVVLLLVGGDLCADDTVTPATAVSNTQATLQPSVVHDNMMATLWVQNAAEYEALTQQIYRTAAEKLREKLDDPLWSADLVQRQSGGYAQLPPAVILDVDETALDNSPFETRLITGEAHTGDRFATDWQHWTDQQRASLVKGAAGFLQVAQQLHVKVFFITNRTARQERATLQNLRAYGIQIAADDMLTKHEMPDWDSSKLRRRAFVAAKHRILMMVGDDLNDFFDGVRGTDISTEVRKQRLTPYLHLMGEGWFLLPNPMYGSWARSLPPNRSSALRH